MDGMLTEQLNAQNTEIVSSLQGSSDEVRTGLEEERAERVAAQEKLEERIAALESSKRSVCIFVWMEWWLEWHAERASVCDWI